MKPDTEWDNEDWLDAEEVLQALQELRELNHLHEQARLFHLRFREADRLGTIYLPPKTIIMLEEVRDWASSAQSLHEENCRYE